jgi:glycosyltransferase involved in cell wall biosynthesis
LVANASVAEVSQADSAGSMTVLPAPIVRTIAPFRDLRALLCLVRIFVVHRFDLVHSVTPKAGLLAMAAGWLARVPVRIHTFTGQVWAAQKGPARGLLRVMDRLIARLATHVLVDSRSQREFLLENRVVSAAKSTVLADGSICGVDGARFRPDDAGRAKIRRQSSVPDGAVVFLYLGRLSRDKGVLDLALAFARLAQRHASAYLAYVGPDEEFMRNRIEAIIAPCANRVRLADWTDRPEGWMAAADVFCLPSYREGFGQVAVEAAACGLPVVASRIYGVVDAVLEGQTGLLHPPGDIEALHRHMETLFLNPDLRRALGDAGRARALRNFSAERVTHALLDYYAEVTRKL